MATPNAPAEDRTGGGIGRWWKRVRTLFKRKKPTDAAPATPAAPTPAPETSVESSKPAVSTATGPSTVKATTTDTFADAPTTKHLVYDSTYQREKTRELFAKYGFDLDVDKWIIRPIDPSRRVEKKIRMRVRRKCHQCQTTIGANKICSQCDHVLCKECPRYPAKKKKKEPEPAGTSVEAEKLKAQREFQAQSSAPSKSGGGGGGGGGGEKTAEKAPVDPASSEPSDPQTTE